MTERMTYVVNTLNDMAAIPAEAIPRFLEEFPTLLAGQMAKREMIKAGLLKDAGNVYWVDDGNKTITARIINSGDTPNGE